MLSTNTVKVKERSRANEKLSMLSTNKTKPKGFNLKGKKKGAPPSKDIITTSNVKMYRARYEKEMEKGKKK